MSDADRPEVSIVVPALREAPNIPMLASEICSALGSNGPSYELIIVDDDSRDGTVEVCARLQAQGIPIALLVRKHEKGLSTAVLRGFERAVAPVFVVMDADLSHPADRIPALYREIQNGADFVLGSRYVPGGTTDDKWTVYRFLNSKLATLLAMPLVCVSDPMSGFFAVPRSLWERADPLLPVGYKIGLELITKGKPSDLREIPIGFRTRRIGESKLTLAQQLLYLKHLCSLYRYRLQGARSVP